MAGIKRVADHWQIDDTNAICGLCPQKCTIGVGKRGKCRSRENHGGELIAVNYGKSIAVSIDPIEKKPLYHFHPGSHILSIGPNSCNLSCFFCQNYSVSQYDADTVAVSADSIRSFFTRNPNLRRQVAFTYTEPITWFEFIVDIARAIPDMDIVLVSNGYISPGPLEELLPLVQAMNIDLKSIRNDFYRERCGGSLGPVQNAIKRAFERGVHVEITNLLIPGLNDSETDVDELAQYIAGICDQIPLHVSAYHPAFHSDIASTSDATVMNACKIASRYLKHVFAGNIRGVSFQDTHCPVCGTKLITRIGYSTTLMSNSRADGTCCGCSAKLYGVFA